MQQQKVKDAIERSVLYAAGSGEVPPAPPLPAFITNPADSSKYYKVIGIKYTESMDIPITQQSSSSSSCDPDQELGSSCPPDIEHKDPSRRLLGALRSRSSPSPDAKDLTKTVKKLLNIE